MSVLYIALPASLFLVLLAVVAFIWSVRSGQMDDLDTPGVRLLLDDDRPGAARSDAEDGKAGGAGDRKT